ncbi:hypothetical protein BC936DRAFT_144830 [Jimgerdemannia flammicorona]|uniref:Uncharacterized protein n=1 Tax=Jimgerdemannia flammicorona TaxID=994334 RepID=A0A433DBK5_9FUNG|nr:hypothetical protein BC936DRAFT_144830 [Jimgerdemannia flammicorona]
MLADEYSLFSLLCSDLSSNALSGEIPAQIGNLANLQRLLSVDPYFPANTTPLSSLAFISCAPE